jgi:hypothetical protein
VPFCQDSNDLHLLPKKRLKARRARPNLLRFSREES